MLKLIDLDEDTLPTSSLKSDTSFLSFIDEIITIGNDYATPMAKTLKEYIEQHDRSPSQVVERYDLEEIVNEPTYVSMKRSLEPEVDVYSEEKTEQLELLAYPNPFNSTVTFKVNSSYGIIRIADIHGRILMQDGVNDAGELTMNANKLAPGVYVASYSLNGQTRNVKLIKY